MRALVVMALGAAALAVPASLAAAPDARGPRIVLRATFVEAEFKTTYRAVVSGAAGRTIGNVVWRFTKPRAEPSCTRFSGSRLDATWLHGDQHGCDHTKMGANGHGGVVRVAFTLGKLRCRATYRGTETGSARGRCS